MTARLSSLCQRTPLRGIQLHLTAAFFLKVISLKVDEVKLVATSSDIALCYLVISEHFSISAIKMYFVFQLLLLNTGLRMVHSED